MGEKFNQYLPGLLYNARRDPSIPAAGQRSLRIPDRESADERKFHADSR
jgi:hypothetical protein